MRQLSKKKDTYVYKIDNNLYINLTNKCQCDCVFCVRAQGNIDGFDLFLTKPPTVKQVIDLLFDALVLNKNKDNPIKEVVFCGFGEPTFEYKKILKIGQFLNKVKKEMFDFENNCDKINEENCVPSSPFLVRLDTNGLGSKTHNLDLAYLLKNCLDVVSVSLNAPNEMVYNKITKPCEPDAYNSMLKFASDCVKYGLKVTMTAVDILTKTEIEECKKIAFGLGANFRLRSLVKN
ncbi:MAG: hypothetical protein FWD86_03165 [Firmicutes bacterium]|nr:hypothetical protein [Bacillota bacterium]